MSSEEPYRPRYHFTPPAQWLNDPNGLVHYAGEYHLFYQYHPHSTVWGPMHWGHAVSADLVNWQHRPIALYPDSHGAIYSGSAVVDWHDTAGFGREALVLVFTHAKPDQQAQSLAYSTDRGRTWTKYPGNPVLPPPEGLRDFRDPKVFWHGDGESGHWVMALAASDAIRFYTAPDLIHWTAAGVFGPGHGAHGGAWETPELVQLPVDGGPETRWVLAVGVDQGGPAGGSGTQYFVGHFDGQTFTNQNPPERVLWADWGADFYAAQAWTGAPGGRRVWIGWLSNWRYARAVPTAAWRGAFSLPRELALVSTPAGPRLAQRPVPELAALRGQPQAWGEALIVGDRNAGRLGEASEIMAEFSLAPETTAECLGLRLWAGDGQPVVIGYRPGTHTLFVERLGGCQTAFSPDFAGRHAVALTPEAGRLRLQVWVDRSSLEVFADDGQVVLSDLVFACPGEARLELFAQGGAARLRSLVVWPLRAAAFLPVTPAA